MDLHLKLGNTGNGIPLEWNNPNNGHAFITGTSGTGKSYLIKSLLTQLPSQGFRIIIFDCSADYLENSGNPPHWPPSNMEILDMHNASWGLNIFSPIYEGESADDIARRVSTSFKKSMRLGPTQWVLLTTTLIAGLNDDSIRQFSDLVKAVKDISKGNPPAKLLLVKLQFLDTMLPRGSDPHDWKLDQPGITVVDLHQYDAAYQNILIEFLLSTICGPRMSAPPSKEHPVLFVFDECQRISLGEGSFANRLLREGRKFQLSAWFSTQWISDRESQKALDQAALRIYFRPDTSSLHKTVLSLGLECKEQQKTYERRLASLPTGCFMCKQGRHYRFNKVSRIG